MRTQESLTTALILILAATFTSAPAQEKKLSNTYTASCIVRVTVNPAILPLNERTVMNLLSSSDVGRGPLRQILGDEIHGDLDQFIEIEWLSGALQRTGRAARAVPGSRPSLCPDMSSGGVSAGAIRAGGHSSDDHLGGGNATAAGAGGMGMMGGGMGMGDMEMMGGGMRGMGGGMMGGSLGYSDEHLANGMLQQDVTFGLSVNLPEEANAAAEELLEQLIKKMQESLNGAFERYEGQLSDALTMAEEKREYAQSQLDGLTGVRSPRYEWIERALDQNVDMSMLSPDMPFSEAVEILRHSVTPPLQITVLWNELADNANVLPDQPIGMDGLPDVKALSALKTLLKAVAGGSTELCYRIDGDVILISTVDVVDASLTAPDDSTPETDLVDLINRRRQLNSDIRQYELRIATSEARQNAIRMQIEEMRNEATDKLKEDSVTQELNRLVDLSEVNLGHIEQQFKAGRISQTELSEAQQKIAQARIELARRREELSQSAGGRQLASFSEELSKLTIDMVENKAGLEILRRQLAEVDQQLARARVSDPRARQIQMARQILQIAEQRVIELNRQLANLQQPIVTTIGAT